jgi:hypothetical protein
MRNTILSSFFAIFLLISSAGFAADHERCNPLTAAYTCVALESSKPVHVIVYYAGLQLNHATVSGTADGSSYSTEIMGPNGVVAGQANPTLELFGAPPHTDFRLIGSGKIENGAQTAWFQHLGLDKETFGTQVLCYGLGWN